MVVLRWHPRARTGRVENAGVSVNDEQCTRCHKRMRHGQVGARFVRSRQVGRTGASRRLRRALTEITRHSIAIGRELARTPATRSLSFRCSSSMSATCAMACSHSTSGWELVLNDNRARDTTSAPNTQGSYRERQLNQRHFRMRKGNRTEAEGPPCNSV